MSDDMALFLILVAVNGVVLISNIFFKSPLLAIVGAAFGWSLAFQEVPGLTGDYYRVGVGLLIAFHILFAVACVIRKKPSRRYVGR